ncbi:MAG: response regulator transcription factor [Ignavibacteriae bacterium]|nr:response regulator transcription factor [Ignavibacteriota bacterium]
MFVRTLIVDDELIARKGVRRFLNAESDIEIIGECADGVEAVETIQSNKPDLVLLDIQMPELDGFGVIEALEGKIVPVIIFITAFDEFALKAFSVHALDYLLKPLRQEQLHHAVERAKSILQFKQTEKFREKLDTMLQYVSLQRKYLERLIIKSQKNIIVVHVRDVDWFEAYGDYIRVHCGTKTHLIRNTMNELEQRLDPGVFARIHRSTILQLNRVRELRPLSNGDFVVTLLDGVKVSLSRTYSEKVLEALQGIR